MLRRRFTARLFSRGGEQVFPASAVPVVSSAAVPKLWPSKHVIKHSVPFQAPLPTFRNGAY